MSRYADIEPIIKKIKYSMEIGEIRGRIWFEMVLADLEKLPEVDVVPVVRCKDCKHSDTFPVCGEPHSFPLKCLSIRYGGVFEDWFCEHGERR